MARNHRDYPNREPPVLHTPRGAAPRGLRSDAFEGRRAAPPPAAQTAGAMEECLLTPPAPSRSLAAEARDWDFALPAPAPSRRTGQLMDMDANRRQHAGLRAPAEAARFPEPTRERFTENWERLASEPLPDRRSKARRKLEGSWLTRWLFSGGRFDLGAAVGPVLLLILLAAALVYGQRLLAGGGNKVPPAVQTSPP